MRREMEIGDAMGSTFPSGHSSKPIIIGYDFDFETVEQLDDNMAILSNINSQ